MDIRFSMGSLRTPTGGRYQCAKELYIRVDYQLSQTILGAKFDENNTSTYFNSKHWQMKVDLNGNMTYLSIKYLLLENLPYDKY